MTKAIELSLTDAGLPLLDEHIIAHTPSVLSCWHTLLDICTTTCTSLHLYTHLTVGRDDHSVDVPVSSTVQARIKSASACIGTATVRQEDRRV